MLTPDSSYFTQVDLPQLELGFRYDAVYELSVNKAQETCFRIDVDGQSFFTSDDAGIIEFFNQNRILNIESVSHAIYLVESFALLKRAEIASLSPKTMELVNLRFKYKSHQDAGIDAEDITNVSVIQKEGIYTIKAYLFRAGKLLHYCFAIGKERGFGVELLREIVLFYSV